MAQAPEKLGPTEADQGSLAGEHEAPWNFPGQDTAAGYPPVPTITWTPEIT